MIFNVLDKWLIEEKTDFLSHNITVEVNEKLGENKQSVVLSNGIKMASIELLKSGTVDFIIIEISSEDVIFSDTIEEQTHSKLLDILKAFYIGFKD